MQRRIRCRVSSASSERGSVLLETAIAIPLLAVVMIICIWCVAVAATALRTHDAARIAARALARGDSATDAREAAHSSAPEATIVISWNGDLVEVTAREKVKGVLPGFGYTVERSVSAQREEQDDW